MALPDGVTTASLTFGQPTSFTGVGASIVLTVKPTASVVHAATGIPLIAFSETFSPDLAPSSIELPHTDQPGFINGAGAAFKDWAYVAEGYWKLGNQKVSFRKVFQLPTGVDVFDLDLIPDGNITLPVTAPVPTVTSVNGETGAVVIEGVTDEAVTALLEDADSDARAALTNTYVPLQMLALDPDSLIFGSITVDSNDATTSASLTWPDGATGAFTALVLSSAFPGAVDSYKVTHVLGGVTKTYTQPTMTRNTTGKVITRPALVVS